MKVKYRGMGFAVITGWYRRDEEGKGGGEVYKWLGKVCPSESRFYLLSSSLPFSGSLRAPDDVPR